MVSSFEFVCVGTCSLCGWRNRELNGESDQGCEGCYESLIEAGDEGIALDEDAYDHSDDGDGSEDEQ